MKRCPRCNQPRPAAANHGPYCSQECRVADTRRKIAAGEYDDEAQDQALENMLARAEYEAGLQPME